MKALIKSMPDLERFIQSGPCQQGAQLQASQIQSSQTQSSRIQSSRVQRETIDFANPEAVRLLNAAILKVDYNIADWWIPDGALCPPIPGRADYIHHIAELLGRDTKPSSFQQSARLLDIGTGANGVYVLLAAQIYKWHCVGSDIRQESLDNVSRILSANPALTKRVGLRLQDSPHHFFEGIMQPNEYFDVTVCNPPFYASQQEAVSANNKKVANLSQSKGAPAGRKASQSAKFNFGGYENELWCNGGEKLFLKKMIKESKDFAEQCGWFTSLISRGEHVAPCIKVANKQGAAETKVIDMGQGNKVSRVLAWRF